MSDVSSVLVPVVVAGGMNAISTYDKHGPGSVVQMTFANVGLFASLTAIGSFVSWDLATLLALLYFMATMLTTGAPVIDWLSRLVSGK